MSVQTCAVGVGPRARYSTVCCSVSYNSPTDGHFGDSYPLKSALANNQSRASVYTGTHTLTGRHTKRHISFQRAIQIVSETCR